MGLHLYCSPRWSRLITRTCWDCMKRNIHHQQRRIQYHAMSSFINKSSFLKKQTFLSQSTSVFFERTLHVTTVLHKIKYKKGKGRINVFPSVIDLIDELGNKKEGITAGEAKNIQKEKQLQLVLVDPKSKPYPTYQLMSIHESRKFEAESKNVEKLQTPVLKEVRLSGNVGDHDLSLKQKQISRWMQKNVFLVVAVSVHSHLSEENSQELTDVFDKLFAPFKDYMEKPKKPKVSVAGRNQIMRSQVQFLPQKLEEYRKVSDEGND